MQAREYLSKLGDLNQTQIFAKIENFEVSYQIFQAICDTIIFCCGWHTEHCFLLQGLTHYDEILEEADGIILSRGNLGIDLPPEKVCFLITHAKLKDCSTRRKSC